MSETAKRLFESLGATAREAASQIGDEMKRSGIQGSMELASALMNGNSFAPYGPGQYTPSSTHQQGQSLQQEQSRGLER